MTGVGEDYTPVRFKARTKTGDKTVLDARLDEVIKLSEDLARRVGFQHEFLVESPNNQYPNQAISETNELREELHWLEKANFAGQIILAVVGTFALLIYRGQLRVMQSTLDEMKRSGEGSTAQANRVIDHMNWLAKEMHNSVNEAHQSIESSQRRNEISIQAIQEQNRPWIKITDVKPRNDDWGFALFWKDSTPERHRLSGILFWQSRHKNAGHSVANNVAVGYKLIFEKPDSFLAEDILKEQKRFCQSFLKGVTDPFDYKVLVFPDETYATDISDGTIIQPSDVRISDSRRQYIRAAVVGCVNYRYTFSTKAYQSGFVYFIDPPEEGRETFEVGQMCRWKRSGWFASKKLTTKVKPAPACHAETIQAELVLAKYIVAQI